MVLIGDRAVGKSYMISTFFGSRRIDFQFPFNEDHVPRVLNARKMEKRFRNENIEIEIHDTSEDQPSGKNRRDVYKDADVFMVCVAKNDRESLENVYNWKEDIQKIEPEKPIALVLTKKDLAYINGESVNEDMIKDLKNQMGLAIWSKASSK